MLYIVGIGMYKMLSGVWRSPVVQWVKVLAC